MSALSFADLRAANATRHVRYWPNGIPVWGHDDWLIALGGEVGEALNVVKKVNRDRLKMAGNYDAMEVLVEKLGAELADVVIYDDILASHFRTDRLGASSAFAVRDFAALRRATEEGLAWREPSLKALSSAGRTLMTLSGRLAEMVPHSNAEFAQCCDFILSACDTIAFHAGIDLGAAVVRTFNATSEKLGFPERLTAERRIETCPVCGRQTARGTTHACEQGRAGAGRQTTMDMLKASVKAGGEP
jgi:NTP pyrophosphatase (non-canonical NTP hydrolase)